MPVVFTNTWVCVLFQGGTRRFSQFADPTSEIWDSIWWCSSSAELDQYSTGCVLPWLREGPWFDRSPAFRLSCFHPCSSCPWNWTVLRDLVWNTVDLFGAKRWTHRFGDCWFCQADNLGRVMLWNSGQRPSVMVPTEPSSLKVWFC